MREVYYFTQGIAPYRATVHATVSRGKGLIGVSSGPCGGPEGLLALRLGMYFVLHGGVLRSAQCSKPEGV